MSENKMKNSDKPIYPLRGANNVPFSGNGNDANWIEESSPLIGLTKREYFAGLAMQGLLSIYDINNKLVPNLDNVKYCAELSVIAADELLKQLNQWKITPPLHFKPKIMSENKMKTPLQELLEELNQLKIASLSSESRRGGDYRIGLTHAIDRAERLYIIEREVIEKAWMEGKQEVNFGDNVFDDAKNYFNKTFNQ